MSVLTGEEIAGALRSPTDSELTRHMMEHHDERDYVVMVLCDQFSNCHAETTAQRHAYLAFGRDTRL